MRLMVTVTHTGRLSAPHDHHYTHREAYPAYTHTGRHTRHIHTGRHTRVLLTVREAYPGVINGPRGIPRGTYTQGGIPRVHTHREAYPGVEQLERHTRV